MTKDGELIIPKQFNVSDYQFWNTGSLRAETACKGWIYHVDILLQSMLLSLFHSYNAVVQSRALQLLFRGMKGPNTNVPFSSVFCLFSNEKAVDVLVRDYSGHTNPLLAHTGS